MHKVLAAKSDLGTSCVCIHILIDMQLCISGLFMAASVQVHRFCEQFLSDRYALFCVPMTAALPAGMSYSDTMGPHAHIVTQGHCKFSRRICSWITFGSQNCPAGSILASKN